MIGEGGHKPRLPYKRAKLDGYWKRYGSQYNPEDSEAQKSEVEGNILIQFRSSASLRVRTQPRFLTVPVL